MKQFYLLIMWCENFISSTSSLWNAVQWSCSHLLPPLISQFIFSQLRFEYKDWRKRIKKKLSTRIGQLGSSDQDSYISDLTRARLLLKLFELETQRIKHGFFRTQFLSASAQHLQDRVKLSIQSVSQKASWSDIRHGSGSSVGWQNIYDKFMKKDSLKKYVA